MLAKRPKLNGSPRRAVLALLAGAAGTALSGCEAIIGAGAPPELEKYLSGRRPKSGLAVGCGACIGAGQHQF